VGAHTSMASCSFALGAPGYFWVGSRRMDTVWREELRSTVRRTQVPTCGTGDARVLIQRSQNS
jgi:hypothetical protein